MENMSKPTLKNQQIEQFDKYHPIHVFACFSLWHPAQFHHVLPWHLRARSQIPVFGLTGRAPGWPSALKLPSAAV